MKRTLTAVGITAALVAGPAAAAHATQTTVAPAQSRTGNPSHTAPRPGRAGATATPACGCEHHRSPGHHKTHHPRKPRHHKPSGHKPCPPPKPKPCPPKHHRHHHPKPVVHPRPPILTPPAHVTTPTARVRLTADTLPTSLPRTGGASVSLAVIGGGALGAGALILSLVWLTEPARRFNREAKR